MSGTVFDVGDPGARGERISNPAILVVSVGDTAVRVRKDSHRRGGQPSARVGRSAS
jgi:hypothetical protein